ncbi:oxidoreductase [Asticcacaulis sp. BYS171W]|uniref:Oxidoreductase n=1 Tax=Asticcacaulis aquaticus TaxID=2984212 RepID=A0ABT5HUL0_9CAUL|nr:oxidoreductase [Asticcacaulis aquaticus]MDC7683748.1 oxidoreductase [Asticcacaulis aquaticus]
MTTRVWFITGASSGMGYALAKAVLALGDHVVAAARRIDRLEALSTDAKGHLLPVQLDVTDAQSRHDALKAAIDRFGRIDVLANIAGRGINGAVEELSLDEVRSAFELNFFGAIEMVRMVLPEMRERHHGHIINMTSICGLVAMSDLGAYCASKFALEAWSEALAGEVRDFGIRVTLVEPGGFRTEFEGGAIIRPSNRIAAYAPIVGPIEKHLADAAGRQLGDPDKAAKVLIEAVEAPSSPLRLVLGSDAHAFWEDHAQRTTTDIASWKTQGQSTDFAL